MPSTMGKNIKIKTTKEDNAYEITHFIFFGLLTLVKEK